MTATQTRAPRRIYDSPLVRRLYGWPGGYTLVPAPFTPIVRRRYRAMRRLGMHPIEARDAVVALMMVGMSSEWRPIDTLVVVA